MAKPMDQLREPSSERGDLNQMVMAASIGSNEPPDELLGLTSRRWIDHFQYSCFGAWLLDILALLFLLCCFDILALLLVRLLSRFFEDIFCKNSYYVQDLLLPSGTATYKYVHEVITQLNYRLSRWDDRLSRKFVFCAANEIELKFVNRMLYLGLKKSATEEQVNARNLELQQLFFLVKHDVEAHVNVKEGLSRLRTS
ncbi:uncharacterized protein LOC110020723 [Phalaenopsis equestris]|uniref:uncharacterized protein LOC110020723 n=1 Tax=Phalaenopsis equestris TaxID=78828 RepID=UPI0009E1D4DF|nr:uncharacterized protein LOC110020723 [Phalaenopsis equestris]